MSSKEGSPKRRHSASHEGAAYPAGIDFQKWIKELQIKGEIVEGIGCAMWSKGTQGVTYINPEFTNLFGISAQKLEADSYVFINPIRSDYKEQVIREMNRINKNNQFDMEYPIVREIEGKNHQIWIHARTFALNAEGGDNRRVGIAWDCTEDRKKRYVDDLTNLQNNNAYIEEIARIKQPSSLRSGN